MQLTVNEVLQLKCLENAKLLNQNCNINKRVEFVDVIEVPDVFNWLRPNTFLLTAAYAIKENKEAQEKLIPKLSNLEVSALSIKAKRFMGEIPKIMVRQANDLNFPLIELPDYILFSDVILDISELIFNKKTEEFQKSLNIDNIFKEIILKDGSIDEIAKRLSTITKSLILIENIDFNLLGYGNSMKRTQTKDDLYANVISNQERHELLLKNKDSITPIVYKTNNSWSYVFLPVRTQEYVSFITMIKSNINSVADITALRHAAFAITLKLNRIKFYNNEKIFIKNKLINKLLSDDGVLNETLEKEIAYFKWPINQHYISIVIQTEEKKISEVIKHENIYVRKLIQLLKNKFCTNDIKVICYTDNNNIIFFINIFDGKIENYKKYANIFIDSIFETFNKLIGNLDNLYIGVSTPAKNIYEIKSSYEESIKAISIGKKIYEKKSVVYYDELDFYNIIINQKSKVDLYNFCNKYLSSLIDSEKNNLNSNLFHTLEVYLNSACSLVEASKKLYIHRNTLIYRLKKIKTILNYNLDNPEIQFKMTLAFKIYKYIK